MDTKQKKTGGVKVGKNDSVLEALQNSLPHWIHHTVEDPKYFGGVKYLPTCDCSVCGFTSQMEHPTCPHCGAEMNRLRHR